MELSGTVAQTGLPQRLGGDDNLTPRPRKDTVGKPGQAPGLSTFIALELAVLPGEKAQVIDLELLGGPLRGYEDQPGSEGAVDGHVSIAPAKADRSVDQDLLDAWAATRNTGADALVDGTCQGRPRRYHQKTVMNHLNKSVTGSSMSAGPNGAGFPASVTPGNDTMGRLIAVGIPHRRNAAVRPRLGRSWIILSRTRFRI